ncbi:hypothetical protein [Paenibacillus piri]|uniref:hypothetical protein n=1 Tax=Paenibacillus piri TaxID=2547395 RepID=UPI001FE83DE2|nr:hypothetical protein [Paenibacillus piri]
MKTYFMCFWRAAARFNHLDPGAAVDIDVVSIDGHALKEKYTFEMKAVTSTPEEMFQRLKLERTFPEDGTIVQTSPKRIEIWYNEGDRTTVHVVYFAVNTLTSITGNAEFSYRPLWEQIGLLQIAHWATYVGLLTLLGGTWFQSVLEKRRGNYSRWNSFFNALHYLSIAAILLELILYKVQYSQVIFRDFINFTFVRITLIQLGTVVISILLRKLRFMFLAISV